jgi:hypothetical protein
MEQYAARIRTGQSMEKAEALRLAMNSAHRCAFAVITQSIKARV